MSQTGILPDFPQFRRNWIDRLVGYFSPLRGTKRMFQRMQYQALAKYDSAKKTRTDRDWQPPSSSADSALLPDLPTIVARSRQAIRDDDSARSAQKAFKRHVVGTGITAVSAGLDPVTEKPLDKFNKQLDRLWRRWSSDKNAVDLEGKKNLRAKQRLWMDELFAAGEVLIVKTIVRRRDQVGLVLQEIESEQFDTLLTQYEGNQVRNGVEIDAYGKAVAYHVYVDRHPLDSGFAPVRSNQTQRIPAERCIHLMDQTRVRQTRGEPFMASGLRRMLNLNRFENYMLIKARFEAAFGGIITDDPGFAGLNSTTPTQMAQIVGAPPQSTDTATSTQIEIAIEPGMMPMIPGGKKINFPPPATPNSQYSPFVQENLKRLAAGFGLDYPTLARWYADGSFSAQLQGLLEMWRETDPLQLLIIDALQEVRQDFITLAVMQDLLEAPEYFTDAEWQDAYCLTNWKGPAKSWINPADQAAAWKILLELGLASHEDYFNEQGVDGAAVFRSRKKYADLADSLDLSIPTVNAPVGTLPNEPRPTKARPAEQIPGNGKGAQTQLTHAQQSGGNGGNGKNHGYAMAASASPGHGRFSA